MLHTWLHARKPHSSKAASVTNKTFSNSMLNFCNNKGFNSYRNLNPSSRHDWRCCITPFPLPYNMQLHTTCVFLCIVRLTSPYAVFHIAFSNGNRTLSGCPSNFKVTRSRLKTLSHCRGSILPSSSHFWSNKLDTPFGSSGVSSGFTSVSSSPSSSSCSLFFFASRNPSRAFACTPFILAITASVTKRVSPSCSNCPVRASWFHASMWANVQCGRWHVFSPKLKNRQ